MNECSLLWNFVEHSRQLTACNVVFGSRFNKSTRKLIVSNMKEVISEKFVLGFGCYCEQVREWRVGGRGIKQNLEQCCCKDEILSRITSRDCLKIFNVEKKIIATSRPAPDGRHS